MEIDLTLVPVTLASFEAACEALGLSPDAVRQGQAPVRLAPERAEALLDTLAPDAEVPGAVSEQAAQAAGEVFFAAAFAQMGAAADRARHHAERCGVAGLGKSEEASLSRLLTKFDPAAYHALRSEMSLEESLTFLLLRSVNHISEHLEDYLT